MSRNRPKFSFEFFPARTPKGSSQLHECIEVFATFSPQFVSVTYGANGGTRHLTQELVEIIKQKYEFEVMPHLTCSNISKAEISDVTASYWDMGIRQILALRGDPPKNTELLASDMDRFQTSIDLINELADRGFKNIYVGAYPELHPDSSSMDSNIDWLKRKFDSGATAAITQFFLDPVTFLKFRDRCVKVGLNAPIIPGILPIDNWEKNKVFITRCGAFVPHSIESSYAAARSGEEHDKISVSIAQNICSRLIQEGVYQFHFYTLNRSKLTCQVFRNLGVLPDNRNRNEKVA